MADGGVIDPDLRNRGETTSITALFLATAIGSMNTAAAAALRRRSS